MIRQTAKGAKAAHSTGLDAATERLLTEIPKQTVDDIIASGQSLPSTGGRTTQIQKTGGFTQANADFDSLGLQ